MLPIRELQRPQLASLAATRLPSGPTPKKCACPAVILWFCENTHISEYMGIYGIYLGPSIRINAMATSEKNENSAGVTLHFETYAKAQKVTSLSIKRLFKTFQNYLER